MVTLMNEVIHRLTTAILGSAICLSANQIVGQENQSESTESQNLVANPQPKDGLSENNSSAGGLPSQQFSAEDIEFFESKIRPVLVESCIDCHSHETELSGGLSLDSRSALLDGGDSGPAIRFEDSNTSLLLKAISYADPNLQMPPDERLSESVVRDFEKWIAKGLPDPRKHAGVQSEPSGGLSVQRASEHWAYRKRITNFEHHSVDEFIDARLAESELDASPPVADVHLVRRLYFDLLGLPPTSQQVEEFVHSDAPDKVMRLVESLLAQPAYGEKFARHWMDVARYAESITLRGFVLPNAWRYRNYLIDAYNKDQPFDNMIEQQVAGDLLAHKPLTGLQEPSNDSLKTAQANLVATTFLVMGNTNLEQQDKTQLEMDYIDEQLEVVGRAFLGQTIGCARCHDHKFDPIPTRDYYALAGIFRSMVAIEHDNVSKWRDLPLPLTPEQEAEYKNAEREIESLNVELKARQKQLGDMELPKSAPLSSLAGHVVDDSEAEYVGKWKSSTHSPRYVGDGYQVYDPALKVESSATFQARSLPPGEYDVRMSYSSGNGRATKVKVAVFSADGEKTTFVNQRSVPAEERLWHSLGTYRFEEDGQAYVMVHTDAADGYVIVDAVQFLPAGEQLKDSAEQGKRVDYAAEQDQLKIEIDRLKNRLSKLQKIANSRPRYMSFSEDKPPQDIPIHVRGNVHNLTEIVPRGVLTAFGSQPEIPKASSGRLEFAKWLSDDSNPLTARVYANRVWSWLMGEGIVASENNFGTTGFAPTHPELLDWLSNELVRSDWSTKHLVRLIVTSNAYQRSVLPPSSKHRLKDPNNALYWNGNLRRLSSEAIRDAMLAVSGELAPAPQGATLRSGVKADYNYQHQGLYRAVYQPVLRNSLPELFESFDFADPSASVGQRSRSTVATQALALSNHPWVIERATAAAKRLWQLASEQNPADGNKTTKGATPEAAALVDLAYRSCLGRPPSHQEQQVAIRFLDAGQNTERGTRYATLLHSLMASIDFRYLR
ncbi:MAG TPA: hypothetical protein DDW52_03225 [Planctomycetaceae bacterium]|nr:hypothetical protein [Planctomycetaceae bacterium]